MSRPTQTDYLTTGRVAGACSVSPKTVVRWIDLGLLPAVRLPSLHGRGGRRVRRADLEAFARAHGIALAPEEPPADAPH